jgi:hypothetical protein
LAGGLNLYGYGAGDPVNNSDPFGVCDQKKGEVEGANGACFSVPAAVGMLVSASVSAIGGGLRMLRSATAARQAAAAEGAGGGVAAAGAAGRGLTGAIVDALQGAGPELGARVDAVLEATKGLDVVHMNTLKNGVVKISGGVGSRLREIYIRPDGSSVVRAFDAQKNAYRIVADIPAPPGGDE